MCDRPLDACFSAFVALEGVFSAFRCLFESVCGVSRRKNWKKKFDLHPPPGREFLLEVLLLFLDRHVTPVFTTPIFTMQKLSLALTNVNALDLLY